MDDREELLEDMFERRMEDMEKSGVYASFAKTELVGLLCRYREQFGLFVSPSMVLQWDEAEELAKKHLGFVQRMDNHEHTMFIQSIAWNHFGLKFFDEEEKMRNCYKTCDRHGQNRNPFYVASIHKKGVVLNENT